LLIPCATIQDKIAFDTFLRSDNGPVLPRFAVNTVRKVSDESTEIAQRLWRGNPQ
jgi:hypothetical protein